MPGTEPTVSAVVRRERARRRLRGATAGAGILGIAAGGLVAYYLPSPAHTSNHSSAGASSASQHSAASGDPGKSESDDNGSGSTSNSGSLGSSSAPTAGSGPAAATSGGS
jgi:hypothetical protein